MVRKTVPSGNKKYVYYVCAAHKQDKSCSPHRMRDEALTDIVLETLRQYIRDVVDLDDILAMTDTAPLRTAEAQKVQRQLDKKRSEYERLQKLLMSLYESLADGIIDREEYARLKQNYAGRSAEGEKQMDAAMKKLASDYLKAVAAGDRLRLFRWCTANEGMDVRDAADFVACAGELLTEMLCMREKNPSIDRVEILRLGTVLSRCGVMLQVNTGVKHIFGLLAVESLPTA
mgnify:CR=1 FL=1